MALSSRLKTRVTWTLTPDGFCHWASQFFVRNHWEPLQRQGKSLNSVATHQDRALLQRYFKPFEADIQGVQQVLAAGSLGKITHVSHRNAHHAAYGRWFDNPELAWFADPALAGGGALLDLGTRIVHLLRSLFGPVESVWATVTRWLVPIRQSMTTVESCFAFVVVSLAALKRVGFKIVARAVSRVVVIGEPAIRLRGLVVEHAERIAWQLLTGETQPRIVERLLALCSNGIEETRWRDDLRCCTGLRVLPAMAAVCRC